MFKNLKLKTVGLIFSLAFAIIGLMSVVSVIIIKSQVSQVQTSWKTYNIDRSDKAKLISLLRAQIGYGGAIHHFKNYILRNTPQYFQLAQSKLIESLATIEQLKSINITAPERKAIADISLVLNSYLTNLQLAKAAFLQEKSLKQIDALVKVDDNLAIVGLAKLNKIQENTRSELVQSKYPLILSLRSHMGYNGFIHHFKNAILRGDNSKLSLAHNHLTKSFALLDKYQTLRLSPLEKNAIIDIRKTLNNYQQNIPKVKTLNAANFLARKIDQQVKVADRPALQGLVTLDQEIYATTQQRSQEVYQLLSFLTQLVDWVTAIVIAITILLISFSLWLVRYRLIYPVTALIDNIKKLAKEDFTTPLKLAKSANELGEMAHSIEVIRENSQKRQEVEIKISTVLRSAMDGIVTIDNNGVINSFNPAAQRLFGYCEQQILNENITCLLPTTKGKKPRQFNINNSTKSLGKVFQIQAKKQNGELFPAEISLNEMWIKEQRYYTAFIRDITERVKSESEVRKMALTDPLTGLANRYLFESKLTEAATIDGNSSLGLVLIDLDKFKPVNDLYGHHIGDLLLKEVAKRLQSIQRSSDTIARVGGDEFAIILTSVTDRKAATIAVNRYQKVLNAPYVIEGQKLDVGASFGLSIFPEETRDLEELYQFADAGMYQEKTKSHRKIANASN